ncbi:hypothetical protein MRX96_000810 [Rhipicephalus microplus]
MAVITSPTCLLDEQTSFSSCQFNRFNGSVPDVIQYCGDQVGLLVVVEGTLRDDLSTKALDGCSHHAALIEHASGQEKPAGSSPTTSKKWLASPTELLQLLAHPLYNNQSSHDAEVQVANYLTTYGAVHEESSQTQ